MPNIMSDTKDNSTAAIIAREAIALAEELDQIRSIYGDECWTTVKRALHTDPTLEWHDTIERALMDWESAHPRFDPNAIF